MARRVFFSFHYERDIWRVNQVRNHWLLKPDRATAGYWDASLWEEAKKKGDAAIKRMIDDGLRGTSVTAVLIGTKTSERTYVQYEIEQSFLRPNGMFGVHIHALQNQFRETDSIGRNPFENLSIQDRGRAVYFSELFPTYDWYADRGYVNFASWVERAATAAGR